MKRTRSTSRAYLQKLYTSILLGGLLFSSSASFSGKNQGRQTSDDSGPIAIRSVAPLFRNYALTTLPDQRTAADTSKQNRVKYSVSHGGVAPAAGIPPATTLRGLLVTTNRSILYLSFRLSRPGGRAPPVSV